ncbi:MAG TPA: hypothetical protein VMZ52_14000, partial [Bryobacteraceae bacterium]|nr:hypothetical protein [Bryobacteraceae bacterium]
AYFKACQSQSDKDFLLIPAEEMNQYLGGHWGILFPKPVYWFMKRAPGEPFQSTDPKYGTVYRAGSDKDMLALVHAESGLMYQTHPRTKGSTGFPDKIRDSEQFRDPRYLGAGWKAMPSDLSSPRLGERAFKTIDDANNWGLRKRMIAEVDVFQLDTTHELYGHMNINYVRLPELPAFAHYGEVLAAMSKGEYFITTGEILLPELTITPLAGDRLRVRAQVNYTFPLRMAEIVWGDGSETHRKIFRLSATREFGNTQFTWEADAKGWKWARVAVWDVAGNGAFVNPIWRSNPPGVTSRNSR